MGDFIVVLAAPFFKGSNEQYITEHLISNIGNEILKLPESSTMYSNNSGYFYDFAQWFQYQSLLVSSYMENIVTIKNKINEGNVITILAVDFWCPGLEQIFLINKSEGIAANYIGYLHGASFVEGDVFDSSKFGSKIPYFMENVWFNIYTNIWHASDFFVKNLPSWWDGVLQKVGEPFDPSKYLKYFNNTNRYYDIVYTGRLTSDRDPDRLFSIIEILLNKGLKVLLITNGYGECENNSKKLMEKFENNYKHIPDILPENIYIEYLSNSKMVVSTALQEGWGYGVLKAVCCGCKPILPTQSVYIELYPECCLFSKDSDVLGIIDYYKNNNPFTEEYVKNKYTFVVGGLIEKGILKKVKPVRNKTFDIIKKFYNFNTDLIVDNFNIGEFLDRIVVSILYKINNKQIQDSLFIRGDDFLVHTDNIYESMNDLFIIVDKLSEDTLKKNNLISFVYMLISYNSRIWGLEATIRMGSDCTLSLEDVGRRTLEIRDINKLRNKVKDAINDLLRS